MYARYIIGNFVSTSFLSLSLYVCIIGYFFCKALDVSSGMTICSEVTIFLGITNSSEVMSLLWVTVSLTEVASFVRNTYVNGADTESASTEGTGTENICIRGACTRGIYSSSACTETTRFGDAGAGDACIINAGAIGCSGTDSQFFRISEVKLFGT